MGVLLSIPSKETFISKFEELKGDVLNFIKANPAEAAAGAAGAIALGAGTVAVAKSISKRKKKTKRKTTTATRRKKKTTTKTKKKTKKRKGRYTPRTAGKGKDRSTRRIRQTKNGQPYVILANGRARFISKKSARLSRKRKGGRY